MDIDFLALIWPVLVAVVACFWALRPRNTLPALAIGFGLLVLYSTVRFAINVGMLGAVAETTSTPAVFPWVQLGYLLWLWVAVGAGLTIGWRARPKPSGKQLQRDVARSLLARIGDSRGLDEAMPMMVDYFAIQPDGIVAATPALVSLGRRDAGLSAASVAELEDRLVDGGIARDVAPQAALVLVREAAGTCLTSASS